METKPTILRRATLGDQHHPTGRTRHFRGGVLLPPPSQLQIAQFSGDSGYYLLYLDDSGNEMTDTYHDSIDAALSQASWEFGITRDEWVDGR